MPFHLTLAANTNHGFELTVDEDTAASEVSLLATSYSSSRNRYTSTHS